MDIELWQAKGQYISLDNHRIFFVDSASEDKSKPIILMIHGFPTSSWDWVKIWGGLVDQYRVIALDLLGFGFSDKPINHHYSIVEQADLVEGLIRHLSLSEFHVLAHDYGDTVAQELLFRQNNAKGVGEWLSVCFLNGGLFPETHRPRLVQRLLLGPFGFIIARLSSKRLLSKNLKEIFGLHSQPSNHELDTFWSLIQINKGNRVFHKLIHYMNERKRYRERWVGALKDSVVPIALINGSADPISGEHMIERYKQVVGEPDSLVQLSGIGHYPQVESPEKVLQHYLGFLDSGMNSLAEQH